jgi:hypothetical protein
MHYPMRPVHTVILYTLKTIRLMLLYTFDENSSHKTGFLSPGQTELPDRPESTQAEILEDLDLSRSLPSVLL